MIADTNAKGGNVAHQSNYRYLSACVLAFRAMCHICKQQLPMFHQASQVAVRYWMLLE